MKKITTIFLLLLSMTATGQTIADLFRSMPSELLPGVSEANKTMLLVDSGKTSVPYALGEIDKIAQSNDFVHIRTSDAGDLQLKVLPLSSDSLIVSVIHTVCAGVCDSRISFYTTNWEKIDQELFLPEISKEIFFNSSNKNSDNYKYAVSLPDIFPISARFGKTGSDLTLRLHYRERLTDDQTEEIKPFLVSDTLLFEWENGSFRLR
ncbi:MAG TPA: DUF3256 family protein [Proteiniphilum sp.]|nr:DUF3256 family protein [Proteiniphilum sp.]